MAQTGNKIAYAAGAGITCTMTSLASGSTRESNSVVNTTAGSSYLDYLVSLTFTIATGTPSGAIVNVYANASIDNTLWPIVQLSSGAPKATTGADQSIGALSTPAMSQTRLIGSYGIQTTASAGERTFRTPAYSVAAAFGGVLPPSFSLFVENQTGVAFSSSTATTATYLEGAGIYTTGGN